MRKSLIILGIAMLTITAFAQPQNRSYAIATRNSNVYSSVSSNYGTKKLCKLVKGDTVLVHLDVMAEPFYKITYNDIIGFVYASDIKFISSANISKEEEDVVLSELNTELQLAYKQTRAGLSMYVIGIAASTVGVLLISSSAENSEDISAGSIIAIAGSVATIISIPVMVTGNKKTTEVLFNMMNVNNSTLTPTIGLKMTF